MIIKTINKVGKRNIPRIGGVNKWLQSQKLQT